MKSCVLRGAQSRISSYSQSSPGNKFAVFSSHTDWFLGLIVDTEDFIMVYEPGMEFSSMY